MKALHAKDCETSWKNFSFFANLVQTFSSFLFDCFVRKGRDTEEEGQRTQGGGEGSGQRDCTGEKPEQQLLPGTNTGDHFLGRQTLESQHSELGRCGVVTF